MSIECYFATCPNHSCHVDPDEGPFCGRGECTATSEELLEYQRDRSKRLREMKASDNTQTE